MRAVERAGITSGDVTLHTLRHTALSRMIAAGHDDYTVMEISGHSSTRMLARYTHPTEERKVGALNLPAVVTNWSQNTNAAEGDASTAAEMAIQPVFVRLRRFAASAGQSSRGITSEDWWTAGGSNSRPPRCERGALPTELAAHFS